MVRKTQEKSKFIRNRLWIFPGRVIAFLCVGGGLCVPQKAFAQISVFKNISDKTAFSAWLQGITLAGQIEGGVTANPARPNDGVNFGNFLSDHANQAQLNQLTLTLSKQNNLALAEYQIGFTLEALYGSDARYYHVLGVSDHWVSGRYQLIPAQAHVDVHLPWLTSSGVDMQAGILQAPMGVETLDPTTRPFYTLAYTSEYSVPFEHIGAMFKWHATKVVDVLLGIDTGNQTSFGHHDNNKEPAGYFGFALNGLVNGKLTITEISRIGPEDAISVLGPHANGAMRYWNDINAVYALTKKVSITGEFNYLHDDGLRADTYSVVTFLGYKVTPSLTLNYRGEIYRDNTGAFVGNFLTNTGYMRAILGDSVRSIFAAPTTYGALTLGLTYRPEIGHGFRVFEVRPEVRFDRSLNGTTPFNDGRDRGMFTFSLDGVLGF